MQLSRLDNLFSSWCLALGFGRREIRVEPDWPVPGATSVVLSWYPDRGPSLNYQLCISPDDPMVRDSEMLDAQGPIIAQQMREQFRAHGGKN